MKCFLPVDSDVSLQGALGCKTLTTDLTCEWLLTCEIRATNIYTYTHTHKYIHIYT